MEEQLAEQLLKAAHIVEERLDQHIAQLEHLEKTSDETELEELRRKRLIELRKNQEKRQELVSNGHGRLDELSNEGEFFQAAKMSTKVVCHFYDSTHRVSLVVDKILEKLSSKYLGTRFLKVKSEKVPFLIKRLNIRKLPTLGIAINGQMVDFIRIIEEFGASEDLQEATLEKRLGSANAIEYREVTLTKPKNAIRIAPKKTIRERNSSGSDDSADW